MDWSDMKQPTPPLVPKPDYSAMSNLPEPPDYGEELFGTLRRRYEECQKTAAKENRTCVIWCYTPNGEEIRINDVTRYADADPLFIQGEDQQDNPCEIIVHPAHAQLVLKLVPREAVPERKPIGFTVVDPNE